jgi:aspartyl-tRNA(Asn)/glutamyl-tRNA(Gln) amidotransferase subunit C
MKLTKQEVEHIADLARIKLSAKEKERFQEQISSILEYVNKLNEVDTEKIEPIAHITGLFNVTRKDEVRECGEKTMKRLVESAPQHEDKLIKTLGVFE